MLGVIIRMFEHSATLIIIIIRIFVLDRQIRKELTILAFHKACGLQMQSVVINQHILHTKHLRLRPLYTMAETITHIVYNGVSLRGTKLILITWPTLFFPTTLDFLLCR